MKLICVLIDIQTSVSQMTVVTQLTVLDLYYFLAFLQHVLTDIGHQVGHLKIPCWPFVAMGLAL